MEFVLDTHSALPVYQQIQAAIKLALLLGTLRPGDTLPSIRDVERQAHISRNIVRKAYLALQRSGILALHHGKGVLVDKQLTYSQHSRIMEQCEKLSAEFLARIDRMGISGSAFARYLYQQASARERMATPLLFADVTKPVAEERAATISLHWQVNVRGLSLDDIKAMDREELRGVRYILTNYLRLDEVRKYVKRSPVGVLPLSLVFTGEMRNELRRLPANASVMLVLDDRDYPSLRLILENYRKVLVDQSVKLEAMPYSKIHDVEKYVKSSKYHKIIFSNRVWYRVPEKLRKLSRVTKPRMEIDLASLESVRIHAGVII